MYLIQAPGWAESEQVVTPELAQGQDQPEERLKGQLKGQSGNSTEKVERGDYCSGSASVTWEEKRHLWEFNIIWLKHSGLSLVWLFIDLGRHNTFPFLDADSRSVPFITPTQG